MIVELPGLFSYFFFGISCKSSAGQMTHIKCQALFSLKMHTYNQNPSAAVVISILKGGRAP